MNISAGTPISNTKSITASIIGNVLEWYDFIIFATLSPILSTVFFPSSDPIVGIALTFTIFAVGFIARPLGGIFFGYMADKLGRRKAFIWSLLIPAIAAFCIALLPSYNAIGQTAAFLLLFFRLMQGLAVGGEYPALVTYIAEIAPAQKRGFFCSYINVTTVVGALLATLLVLLLNTVLTKDQMIAWGWRIPFVLTFISVLFGFYLRLKMLESPLFKAFQQKKQQLPILLWYSLQQNMKALTKVFCFTLCAGVAY